MAAQIAQSFSETRTGEAQLGLILDHFIVLPKASSSFQPTDAVLDGSTFWAELSTSLRVNSYISAWIDNIHHHQSRRIKRELHPLSARIDDILRRGRAFNGICQ